MPKCTGYRLLSLYQIWPYLGLSGTETNVHIDVRTGVVQIDSHKTILYLPPQGAPAPDGAKRRRLFAKTPPLKVSLSFSNILYKYQEHVP